MEVRPRINGGLPVSPVFECVRADHSEGWGQHFPVGQDIQENRERTLPEARPAGAETADLLRRLQRNKRLHFRAREIARGVGHR